MRRATACLALAGCIPVSYTTTPSRIHDAASTLQREGTAVVPVDVDDDHPSRDSPSTRTIEVIRPDERIRVRLGAQAASWSSPLAAPIGAEQAMTMADLLADCPPDLDNSDANRLAFPRCKLFRAGAIRLHGGHRRNGWKLVVAGYLAGVAGDATCVVACATPVSYVALGVLGLAGAAGLLTLFVYELTKDVDLKHGY